MNKNIILCITGGIAAYKSAFLVRLLRKIGNQVKVIMTDASKQFITPITMQTLSGNIVYDELFKRISDSSLEHIELANWADLILIAPASANFIAKLAYGHANDLLITVCLATTAPIAIAPAMNKNMWLNSATQENVNKLIERGIHIFGPDTGELASGAMGVGRMLEPNELLTLTQQIFENDRLKNYKVVITAGPTREPIDPVRYLTNRSSGKMGYAIASAAIESGAKVTLISGPTNLNAPNKAKLINVITAQEMYDTVMEEVKTCDIFIATAAVSDYSPADISENKIKKTADTLTITLKTNPDILASVAALPNKPFTVGFAAETENVLENAYKKLNNKKLDMVVANKVGLNQGFDRDDNALTILQQGKEPIEFKLDSKSNLGRKLVHFLGDINGVKT